MRVTVFCQDPIRLVREMIAEIGQRIGPCTFVAGRPDSDEAMSIPNVNYILAPAYHRETIRQRAVSWIAYAFHAFVRGFILSHRTDLFFFVSSPPFIGVLGYVLNVLARKQYVLLVYDLYPDIAENFGTIRRNSLISKFWRLVNRQVYSHAKRIITISEEMARNISDKLIAGCAPGKVVVIPTWVDTKFIRPLSKPDNPFALEYGQRDKITVLYAGNLGNAADVAMIPRIAHSLKDNTEISFFLVGRGEKTEYMRSLIQELSLANITMLPYQPETTLPYMLAMADVSLVMLDRSANGKSVPSKTYYYMAAGSAILAYCAEDDALVNVINGHHCGLSVQTEECAVEAIRRFADDDRFLEQCKVNSRRAAEMFFDKDICLSQIMEALAIS